MKELEDMNHAINYTMDNAHFVYSNEKLRAMWNALLAKGIFIDDCFDCNECSPEDSLGGGCRCLFEDNTGRHVDVTKDHTPIPDWCPKRNPMKGNKI